jgi:radical SAM protein with 4Fe4S-binding SPASM domain
MYFRGVTKADFQQARYYLSHLTFVRFLNFAKLWSSFHVSRLAKRPVVWGMPSSISIEPTTACNLGCPECPSGLKQFTRPTGNLKPELLGRLFDQTEKHIQYCTFYFQGEPFIHPKITELFKEASDRNIFSVTSTNAHFISEKVADDIVDSGLNKLIISIDGTTQEVYEQYRIHGKLDKVLAGTREILAAKKRKLAKYPLVYFQFLVVKPNEHQIDDVEQLGKEMGVDGVLFKTAQVYEYENGNPLIPTNEKYARYKKGLDGKWRIKNKLLNQCWKMWQSCVITWDGKVVPCCFDKDATHQMGSIANDDFKEIWHGASYQNFRSQLLKSRSEIDICKNCSEGTKVWT